MSLHSLVEQPSDLQSVKETLIDIGVAVALAFRETSHSEDANSSEPFLQRLLALLMPKKQIEDDRFSHLNISPRERESLLKLSEALS